MRVIIDIGHPAHVHLFKNLAWRLQEKGHKVLFTCRDREHVVYLLKTYGFVYENFGQHYKSIQGKLYGLAKNEMQMLNTALRFKPDLFISHGSTIAAHASFLVRKPHIALEDTFNMEQVRLSMPFTDVVLTGDYPHPSLGKKEIQYPGYHELAYLHPNVFTPDEGVLNSLALQKNDKYAIVRFVAWNASHDVGLQGISSGNKRKLLNLLSPNMKVFISSEAELPDEFKQFQIQIQPEDMHSALAFAHLFLGESGTMASEAAVLGIPSFLYLNSHNHGVLLDQKKLGLLMMFGIDDKGVNDSIDILSKKANEDSLQIDWQKNRESMLSKKIDLSSFLCDFVVDYLKNSNVTGMPFDWTLYKYANEGVTYHD